MAGEEIQMVEVIANRKLLPLPWLRLESLMHVNLRFAEQDNLNITTGEYFQNHRSMFSLMSYKQVTRRHRVTCSKRGYYSLQSVAMTCGDLVSYAKVSTSIPVQATVTVYPPTIPLEELPLPAHSWQGDSPVKRWIVEDPFYISGVREYRYGDSLNGINWNATARSGKLQVHQREFTADHRVMIYLNVEESAEMWRDVINEDRIEQGIIYAATLIERTLSQGIETGFGYNGPMVERPKNESVRIHASSGQQQWLHLLDTMARLLIVRSQPFDEFLQTDIDETRSNTDYIFITAFVSDKIQYQVERLERNGNAVIVLPLLDDIVHEDAKDRPVDGEEAAYNGSIQA